MDPEAPNSSILHSVHPALMNTTARRVPPITPVLVVLFIMISPVSASLFLSKITFSPDAPLITGGHQQLTADYTAGAETFAPGHELQLRTNLTRAMWAIQVRVDGQNAARQEASGSLAFVNGEILSYPTDRDLSLRITIDGTVPADATAPGVADRRTR